MVAEGGFVLFYQKYYFALPNFLMGLFCYFLIYAILYTSPCGQTMGSVAMRQCSILNFQFSINVSIFEN